MTKSTEPKHCPFRDAECGFWCALSIVDEVLEPNTETTDTVLKKVNYPKCAILAIAEKIERLAR